MIDVSFISLAKVLPAVLACAAERFDCLALVKPQFEVGRARLGKGGVVRDAEARRAGPDRRRPGRRGPLGASVLGLRQLGAARAQGQPRDRSSGWRKQARGGVADLERAAREVEP